MAKFRFRGQNVSKKIKPLRSNLTNEQKQLWQDFAQKHLKTELVGTLQTFGDQLYLVPQGLPDISKLKIARNGLHLGTFKKKRFEPSFALGLALQANETVNNLKLNEQQFYQYVAGETINLDKDLPNGWYQILVNGNGLGFAKLVSGTLKNSFPKGLRFQSN